MGSHRKFGLPVKEATKGLTIPLLQVDIDKATAKKTKGVDDKENFLSCVVAQAATRVTGADRVAIMRRTAYVAFPGDKCARRYEVDDKSRATLEKWDRGEHIVEGVELELKPPGKQRTLKAMRATYGKYHARTKRDPKQRKTTRKQRRPDPLHNVVRNGNLVRWGDKAA